MKRRGILVESFRTRRPFNSSPSDELLLARLLRRRSHSGNFTRDSVSPEAFKHGIELDEERINIFLDELVSDVVDETVTPAGERMYILARTRSHGTLPKQGEPETVTVSKDARSKKGARGFGNRLSLPLPVPEPSRPRRSRQPSRQAKVPADAGGESPNDHTAIAAWRSAHAALGADPNVKCIAPLHLDGGTSFRISAPTAAWGPALRDLVLAAERGQLPKTIDLTDGQTGEVLTARVGRSDVLKGTNIIFGDGAQLRIFPRKGTATLVANSGALWREGARAWMTTWFDRVTGWLTGRSCPLPEEARAMGWSTAHVELASDFTGLTLFHEDAQRFVTGGGDVETIHSRKPRADGQAETINIGSRGNDRLALSTHDKTRQLGSKKRNPATSVYAPTWLAYGWDGEAIIRRVEVRAHGRALDLIALDGSGVTLDLTDPASLLDPAMVGAFWLHATTTRTRLLARDGETTDPRWLAVQAAGGIAQQVRFAQVSRAETRRLDLAERRALAEREAARKLGCAHGLFGGGSLEELVAHLVRRPEYKAALRVNASSARDDIRASLAEHPQDEDVHIHDPGEHIASEDVH